jgi:hypothetical protein
MACTKRQQTGYCGHDQCPFPEESEAECVAIEDGLCECGEDCYSLCPYSVEAQARETTTDHCKEWFRKAAEVLRDGKPLGKRRRESLAENLDACAQMLEKVTRS